jgi:hypothetical protein
MKASNRLTNVRRRANRARLFPVNTCGASRHVELIAAGLVRGYPVMKGEEVHCAESMYAVLECLWKARTKLKRAGLA